MVIQGLNPQRGHVTPCSAMNNLSLTPILTGLLKPAYQREWGEGAGEAISSAGLSFKGISAASINGRLAMAQAALLDAKTAANAAKIEAQTVAKARIENNVSRDAAGLGSSATRDFNPGTTQRAENINAGQVTDRDLLQRIDEAKTASSTSQGLKEWDWPAQRPAWMEGTTVQDQVLAKPETYRMVVNESEYEAIRTAIQRGDSFAAKNLGGWATKDSVTSAADVRGKLAISSEWKGQ